MTDILPASAEAESLRGLLAGRFFLPDEPGYDEGRTPWNTAVELRPAAVATPRSVDEVQTVVRAAAAAGLRVAPISTGHGAGRLAERDLSRTILVRLSELTGITVDPVTRTARVIGGTVWNDVVAAASQHGLTAAHGSAGDVAVAGYALSGGLSFYGRRHGLAVNTVRAVELVTASGQLLRLSEDENEGLFWAVRGGGGNFGVVTAVEIELLPYPDVYAGMLLWDAEHAARVLPVWRELTMDAPESLTTSLRIMSFPPLPELPPFLSGRDLVVVDGAALEADDAAAELLAPLRALGPELDTFGRIPADALTAVHMDPPAPSPYVAEHAVLGSLPDTAITAFLDATSAATRGGLMFAELRQLGGALARRPRNGGAVSSVDGAYGLFAVAMTPVSAAVAAGRAAVAVVKNAMAPWTDAYERLLTFAENPESGVVYGGARERLAYEALRVDPRSVFVAGHPIR